MLLAAALVPAGAASAQPAPSDPDFEQGRTLLDAGHFAEACSRFKVTYDQKATAGKAFNLSVCEEKQGHLLRAVEWMSDGMSLLDAGDERRAGALDRREGLERRLGRLVVTLAHDAPPGTELTVDGTRIEVGARTPVDPGRHVIVARAAGREDASSSVDVPESGSKQIEVSPGRERGTEPPPRGAPLAPRAAPDGAGQRIAGAAVTGLGVASFVGFGVTAGLVASKHSDFQKASAADRPGLASSGRSLEVAEAVLLGIGIAASVTGVVVIATAPRRSSTALSVTPTVAVDATSGSLGVRGRF